MALFGRKQKAIVETRVFANELERQLDQLARAVFLHYGANAGQGSLGESINRLTTLVLPNVVEQTWKSGGTQALVTARTSGQDAVERELRDNVSMWVHAGTDPADVHARFNELVDGLLRPYAID